MDFQKVKMLFLAAIISSLIVNLFVPILTKLSKGGRMIFQALTIFVILCALLFAMTPFIQAGTLEILSGSFLFFVFGYVFFSIVGTAMMNDIAG